MNRTITVAELKEFLNTIPDETNVDYFISNQYYEKVFMSDFIYDAFNKTLLIKIDG